MSDFLDSINREFNPSFVDFGDLSNVTVYVVKVLLLAIAIGLIIYSIVNFRKIIVFLRQTASELRKVEWLKRNETVKLSIITLTTVSLFLVFLYIVDSIYASIRTFILF